MPQASGTKELILDAAETLFGAQGVEGVSLRSLTKAASVNLASVHYHFGSKEAVVKAVFLRRIRPINRERVALLDELESRCGDGPVSLESVLTALFLPVIRTVRKPQRQRSFQRLCARFYFEPADYLESLFEQEFGEVSGRFERAFGRALPNLSPTELRRRMRFAVGVMVHTMLDNGRTHRWPLDPPERPSDQEVLDSMVRFVAGGMRAASDADGAAAIRAAPLAEVAVA